MTTDSVNINDSIHTEDQLSRENQTILRSNLNNETHRSIDSSISEEYRITELNETRPFSDKDHTLLPTQDELYTDSQYNYTGTTISQCINKQLYHTLLAAKDEIYTDSLYNITSTTISQCIDNQGCDDFIIPDLLYQENLDNLNSNCPNSNCYKESLDGSIDKYSTASISLEQIREGLGLLSISNNSLDDSHNNNDKIVSFIENNFSIDTAKQKFHLKQKIDHDSPEYKYLFLCHELSELLSLLNNRRQICVQECKEKKEIMHQFESLYDSVRSRESQISKKFSEQLSKLDSLHKKYQEKKMKISDTIHEYEITRKKTIQETEILNTRLNELEELLNKFSEITVDHNKKIEEWHNEKQNTYSEKEITNLNLCLRSLQNKNSQLLTDNATLKYNLDILLKYNEKKLKNHINGSEPFSANDSLANPIGLNCIISSTTNYSEVLVKNIQNAENLLLQQKSEYLTKKSSIKKKTQEYCKYVQVLNKMITKKE